MPGVRCCNPPGAFCDFPNIRGLSVSSRELASRLMREAGVATLARAAFCLYGEGCLRPSYATSLESVHCAVKRICEFPP